MVGTITVNTINTNPQKFDSARIQCDVDKH